jgi:cytoskeleton protein RodZ
MNLEAIESDDLGKISSPFLYRSFVRQFGKEVGLDFESLEPDLKAASGSMPEPLVPGQADAVSSQHKSFWSRIDFDLRWLYPAFCLVGVVALCSAFYTFRLKFGPNTGDRLQAVETAPAIAAERQASENPLGEIPVNEPKEAKRAAVRSLSSVPVRAKTGEERDLNKRTAEATAAPQRKSDSAIRIELVATEPTWLSVATDGKMAYSGILEATETKTLEGHETARIRTGNAGGVNVVFNGKDLGTLGPRGQTRTVLFTRTGYEVLQRQTAVEMQRVSRSGD